MRRSKAWRDGLGGLGMNGISIFGPVAEARDGTVRDGMIGAAARSGLPGDLERRADTLKGAGTNSVTQYSGTTDLTLAPGNAGIDDHAIGIRLQTLQGGQVRQVKTPILSGVIKNAGPASGLRPNRIKFEFNAQTTHENPMDNTHKG
jgi:hypothetical protein